MSDTSQHDAELNAMIAAGKGMDAFEKFYADEVVMMENDQAFTGKDANRQREHEFFGSIQEVHEMSLGRSAVNGDTSFCEQVFDATFKDGTRRRMEQVALRVWKDGKVVSERFFYKGG